MRLQSLSRRSGGGWARDGHGGGAAEAQNQGTTFLGEVPIFTEIREGGDAGVPVVVSAPESAPAEAFGKVAATLRELLD